jgi:hypothetical protein
MIPGVWRNSLSSRPIQTPYDAFTSLAVLGLILALWTGVPKPAVLSARPTSIHPTRERKGRAEGLDAGGCQEAIGHGIKRSKSGDISFDLLEVEAG